MILVLSTSLDPGSRSRVMALRAAERLAGRGEAVETVDLQSWPLPMCDASAAYGDANVKRLAELVAAADGVLLASPVYNYDVSAAAKNVIELTGSAWNGKVVGFLLAAGGRGSYMSPMGLANSLMLDFRCLILPRFAYAEGSAFEGDRVADEKVAGRIDALCDELVRVSRALTGASVSG